MKDNHKKGFLFKQKMKMICQHVIFPVFYRLNCFRGINKKMVVFADAHKEQCPSSMQILKQRLDSMGYDTVEYFFDIAKLSTLSGMRKMIKFMRLYAMAGFVVLQDNFLPVSSCKKRKGTRVIQLWHGCGAFKRFGFDAKDDIPEGYKGNVYSNYDLVTVSGEGCVPFFESAMRQDKGIVNATGVSRTDRFYDREYIEECKARFRYYYPDSAGKKVVLYAPTFRGNAAYASCVGEEEIDMLAAAYPNELYVIKSLHPHLLSKRGLLANDMSTDDLLVCADVLITDYSSVFFEYLLTDGRIIFYAPDFDDYSDDRGYYLDYNRLPGDIVKNVRGEMAAERLADCIFGKDEYSNCRKEYKQQYMGSCDGNATDKIIEYIRQGGKRC